LRRGDLLTHADGLPITTEDGARRLFGAEPGTSLSLTYERNGSAGETRIVAEEPPTRRAPRLEKPPRPDRDHLRFAGSVGDVDVEVRGLDSVQVTVDEVEGTVVIRTLDAVVRLAANHSAP
jgi:hypothetical protein